MTETKKKAGRPKKKQEVVEAPAISLDQAEHEELQEFRKKQAEATRLAELKKQDYTYFADFDKGSAIPAWMLKRPTEDLEREVVKLGKMIENKQVPDEEVYTATETYNRKKERLEGIKNSKPKLTGMQKDRLRRVRDQLAADISDSKFTRLEMEKYLVDAHEEARRMSEPIVEIDRVEAARMGISVNSEGKISRNKAETAWKMACMFGKDLEHQSTFEQCNHHHSLT